MENNFGNNIQFLRKKFNKTQTDIALQVKKTQKIVSNWENGKTEPTVGEIGIMSKYFGISVGDLLFSDLQNDSLIEISGPSKKQGNDSLNDSGNDSLKAKINKNYKGNSDLIHQVAEESAAYAVQSQAQKMAQLYEAQISALNMALSAKDAVISQLSADNERLKRDILVYESAIVQQPKLKTPKQVLEGSSHGHK